MYWQSGRSDYSIQGNNALYSTSDAQPGTINRLHYGNYATNVSANAAAADSHTYTHIAAYTDTHPNAGVGDCVCRPAT